MKYKFTEMAERIHAIPRSEYPELVWALKRGEWDDRLGSKPEHWGDMDQCGRINAASKQIDYLESVSIDILVVNQIYDVMSYLFTIMICYRNTVLQVIHEDAILLGQIA